MKVIVWNQRAARQPRSHPHIQILAKLGLEIEKKKNQKHQNYGIKNETSYEWYLPAHSDTQTGTNYLKWSFSYSGAMLWNNLPKCLKNAVSVNNFKHIIRNVADISDSHTAII